MSRRIILITSFLFVFAGCDDGIGNLRTVDDIRQIEKTSDLSIAPTVQKTITAKHALKTAVAQAKQLQREVDLILIKTGEFSVNICFDCETLPVSNSWIVCFADRPANEVVAIVVDDSGVIDVGTLVVPERDLAVWEAIDVNDWAIDSDNILLPEGFRSTEDVLIPQFLQLISLREEAVWLQLRDGEVVTVDSAEKPMRYIGLSLDDDVPVAWATIGPFSPDPWKAKLGEAIEERPWF